MVQETFKYKDFLGNDRENTIYFNLTEAEILELELSKNGGMSKYYEKLISTQNVEELSKVFKELLLLSVGEISDDGSAFVKTEQYTNWFKQTDMYNQLYVRMCTDTDYASKFWNGLIPTNTTVGSAGDTTVLQMA